jgi:hypothetical protein
LTRAGNTLGSSAASDLMMEAKEGVVDHTRDEVVGESGREAIGPVGRNRWYAVVFFRLKEVGWWSVETMA